MPEMQTLRTQRSEKLSIDLNSAGVQHKLRCDNYSELAYEAKLISGTWSTAIIVFKRSWSDGVVNNPLKNPTAITGEDSADAIDIESTADLIVEVTTAEGAAGIADLWIFFYKGGP